MKLIIVNSIEEAIRNFAVGKVFSKNEKYSEKRPRLIPTIGIIENGTYFLLFLEIWLR